MPRREKLRVLFVDNTFTFGGAIVSLSCLVQGLEAHGVESVVVSGQPPETLDRLFPNAESYSIELRLPWIHGDPFVSDPKEVLRSSLGPLRKAGRSAYWLIHGDLKPAIRLARIAKRHDAGVIHLNNNSLQTDGALAALFRGVPCVAHHRNFPDGEGRSVRFRASLPDHNVAVSEAVRTALVARGIAPEKTTTVHDAIDVDRFAPAAVDPSLRAELGIAEEAPVIGFFGRLVRWKGVIEFVEILAAVAEKMPDVQALVVGDSSDGPEKYERRVRERVTALALDDRVTFTGFREDLPELYRLCDVVAHTSIEPEPFGMVIIEAMACGTPVVASHEGGPREIIRDGVDGYVSDPTDADAFAGRLVRVLRDEPGRAEMARAGVERVHDAFTGQRYAEQVLAVYDRVTDGAKS